MRDIFEQKTNKFFGIYRGKVIDNVDPQKLGRIKVQVFPIFSDLNKSEDLPWAVPAYPIWEGSGVVDPKNDNSGGIGTFIVPKIDTWVFVFFEEGDPYQPVYFAEAPTAKWGLPIQRQNNYPDRKVLRTRSGIEIYVDTKINEIMLIHPTGTTFKIDTLGNVYMNIVSNWYVNVANNIRITAGNSVIIEGGTEVHINP